MTTSMADDFIFDLVRHLCSLPNETEWVEFKVNNSDPDEIGEYISALSNAAVLAGQPFGYLVWGVDDKTHNIIGTTFEPRNERIGAEELENWLTRLLSPQIPFNFQVLPMDDHRIVLLKINKAFSRPARFKSQEFIRVGSYKKKLSDHPEKERALWRAFDETPFEESVAADHIADNDVLKYLDYPTYFELLDVPLPENRRAILEALEADRLIRDDGAGRWDITSVGAILFAKNLEQFPSVRRKPLRIIRYSSASRVETNTEHLMSNGYASGFEDVIAYITGILPSNEVIQQALRIDARMYPTLAVRELVANALIHQDFSITGAGPMVEIFADRMEITNPGTPLIEPTRFLDHQPRSRNEELASLMRRMGVCEERGSGIDKVVWQTELYQLPAPIFEAASDATRAVLFAHQALSKMEKEDRIRACYLHACLRRVNGEYMTNTTIRDRFGIEPKNSATASRFIREALDTGLIKPYDPEAGKKFMKYVPFWA